MSTSRSSSCISMLSRYQHLCAISHQVTFLCGWTAPCPYDHWTGGPGAYDTRRAELSVVSTREQPADPEDLTAPGPQVKYLRCPCAFIIDGAYVRCVKPKGGLYQVVLQRKGPAHQQVISLCSDAGIILDACTFLEGWHAQVLTTIRQLVQVFAKPLLIGFS